MIRESYNWNKRFDHGAGALFFLFDFSAHERLARRLQAAAEQLDRRLPAAVRLRRGRARRPDRARGPVQPGDADRHDARRPAQGAPGRLVRRPAVRRGHDPGQPRVPQPHAREDGQARDGPADGRVPQGQGRAAADAHLRADPQRRRRRLGGLADAVAAQRRWSPARRCGSTSCARPSSTAAGSPAPGRGSSPRPSTARWRGASTRSCATRRSARRSGPTRPRSGWSTCCCSPSRASKQLLAPLG